MHALMILAGTLLPLFVSLIVSAEWGKVWQAVFISMSLSLISLAILIFIERNNEGGLILIATIVGLPFIFGFSFAGAMGGRLMYKPRA
ncbi:hypothetical protein K7W03_23235 [Sphingobium sp. PNB]|uniref:hypothetical protein n=1 Tax=Sphingobium sp. PNB TaxID=863934 RepID=UPI001CA3B197|nr:hypothetical protein [Sphingobium sp. PNB]MCB4862509.1 hypothetical protein [Sphingobium sp. PNB]